MSSCRAAFAVPGDIRTLTGGYIYDARVVDGLIARDWDVNVLSFGLSFPFPSDSDHADAIGQLEALPADCPVIVDGLALGAMDAARVAQVKAPIIAMIHHPLAFEAGLTEGRRTHLLKNECAVLAHVHHVLVPSSHTAAMLASDYGVDPGRITVARPGTPKPADVEPRRVPPLILSVGIQVPRKGHDILLRALSSIKDLPWQAMIVGGVHDDDHAAFLQDLVQELGLQSRVEFTGRLAEEDLSGLYAQASLFALATRYEGYGIVFNEAMANGLPIVSCNTGAVPDTVAPDAGLLVDPEDPAGFADALRSVLEDDALSARLRAASLAAGSALAGWSHTVDVAERVLTLVQEGALPPSPAATPPEYLGKDEAREGARV